VEGTGGNAWGGRINHAKTEDEKEEESQTGHRRRPPPPRTCLDLACVDRLAHHHRRDAWLQARASPPASPLVLMRVPQPRAWCAMRSPCAWVCVGPCNLSHSPR